MIGRANLAYILIGLVALLLAACGAQETGAAGNDAPPAGETPDTEPSDEPDSETAQESPALPPEVVLDARTWLAEQRGVPADQIEIVEQQQAEWPDSCLGLGRANESCMAVTTPGWRVLFNIDGEEIEVRTGETAEVIRLATPSDPGGAANELAGTRWRFVSFEGRSSTPVEGATITLSFTGDRVEGNGGCNDYSGTYQVDGDQITVNDIISTTMGCEDERVTQQEQDYLQELGQAGTFKRQEDQLLITRGDKRKVLTFEAASSVEPPPEGDASTSKLVDLVTPTPDGPAEGDGHGPEVARTSPDATIEGLTVDLIVDESVAAGVTSEIVPANEGNEDPYPPHIRLTFEEYVLTGTAQVPAVYVYPVNAYKEANQIAAETIESLRTILNEKPLLPPGDDASLPVLPLFNGTPLLQTNGNYAAIQDGFGFTFLTQYGQPDNPINNQELFYTFQGMTIDGAYYVAAILPVSHPDLPDGRSDVPAGGDENSADGIERQLEMSDPGSFSPTLVTLNKLIRSITLDGVASQQD